MPTDVPASILAPLDADGRVAIDAPCVNCGYNLRTLDAGGLCPECAHPVQLSIRGNFLCFAPPRWVGRLARGVLLVVIALVVGVVGGIAWTAASAYAIRLAVGVVPPVPPDLRVLFAAGLIWSLATAGLAIAGLLLVTAREPASRGRPQGASARRIIRIGLWALPIAVVLVMFKRALYGRFAATLFTSSAPIGTVLMVIAGLCWIVCFVVLPLALLRHVMMLMKRIPRPGLVLFARIAFWGLLVTMTITAVGYAVVTATVYAWSRTAFPATTAVVSATAPAPTGLTSGSPNSPVAFNTYSFSTSGQVFVGTRTTTAPTSMPIPPMPNFGPGFFVASSLGGLGGCGTFALVVAAFILLILAQRALAQAARLAEQNAAIASAAVPVTMPAPPDRPT